MKPERRVLTQLHRGSPARRCSRPARETGSVLGTDSVTRLLGLPLPTPPQLWGVQDPLSLNFLSLAELHRIGNQYILGSNSFVQGKTFSQSTATTWRLPSLPPSCLPYPLHAEVSRPGIKPEPQQRQCQILHRLSHQKFPGIFVSNIHFRGCFLLSKALGTTNAIYSNMDGPRGYQTK